MTDDHRPRSSSEEATEGNVLDEFFASQATPEGLEADAEVLHDLTGGRSSGILFVAVLGLPLGCVFIVAFAVAIALIGGAISVMGLGSSPVGNAVGLFAAAAIAFAVVVAVYRMLMPRIGWLRRLVNR